MIKEVTGEEFEQLHTEGLVLVDFFSSTCGRAKCFPSY